MRRSQHSYGTAVLLILACPTLVYYAISDGPEDTLLFQGYVNEFHGTSTHKLIQYNVAAGITDEKFGNEHAFADHWFHLTEVAMSMKGAPLPSSLASAIIVINVETKFPSRWRHMSAMTLLFMFTTLLSHQDSAIVPDPTTHLAFALNDQLYFCTSFATAADERFDPAHSDCSAARSNLQVEQIVSIAPLTAVQRFDWFTTKIQVAQWRSALHALCDLRPHTGEATVIVYQRDENRQLRNVDDVQSAFQDLDVQIVAHSEQTSPCMLASKMAQAKAVVTAHGFNTMVGLFMSPGALLVETYPNLYFKPGYCAFLVPFGVRYVHTLSQYSPWWFRMIKSVRGIHQQSDCTGKGWCRYVARMQDVELSPGDLERVAQYYTTPLATEDQCVFMHYDWSTWTPAPFKRTDDLSALASAHNVRWIGERFTL